MPSGLASAPYFAAFVASSYRASDRPTACWLLSGTGGPDRRMRSLPTRWAPMDRAITSVMSALSPRPVNRPCALASAMMRAPTVSRASWMLVALRRLEDTTVEVTDRMFLIRCSSSSCMTCWLRRACTRPVMSTVMFISPETVPSSS